jgi:aminoglycoside phosphotransferase (APT) family kinase protein
MTIQMSEHERERRALTAHAAAELHEFMAGYEAEHGELTLAEWLSVLNNVSGAMIGQLIKPQWRKRGKGANPG